MAKSLTRVAYSTAIDAACDAAKPRSCCMWQGPASPFVVALSII